MKRVGIVLMLVISFSIVLVCYFISAVLVPRQDGHPTSSPPTPAPSAEAFGMIPTHIPEPVNHHHQQQKNFVEPPPGTLPFRPNDDVLFTTPDGLFIRRGPAPENTNVTRVSDMTSDNHILFSERTQRIIMEIGTNEGPELAQLLRGDAHGDALIAFEPIPDIFTKMVKNIPRAQQKYIVPIPAAISMRRGHVPFYLSALTGCSSLLPLNTKSGELQSVGYDNITSRKKKNQSRTAIYCARGISSFYVPTFPLHDVFRRIPMTIPIQVVQIDAQGFDLAVANTMTVEDRERIGYIVMECQDLAMNSSMFLTQGAVSCGYQLNCMKEWKFAYQYCWWNSKVSSEKNCIYRNPRKHGGKYTPYMGAMRKTYIHAVPTETIDGKTSWCDV